MIEHEMSEGGQRRQTGFVCYRYYRDSESQRKSEREEEIECERETEREASRERERRREIASGR